MGYYIECGVNKGKAQRIIDALDAEEVCLNDITPEMIAEHAVICVVDNGPFEAAAFCYSPDEFTAFTRADDDRSKIFLVVKDRKKVESLTGYNR